MRAPCVARISTPIFLTVLIVVSAFWLPTQRLDAQTSGQAADARVGADSTGMDSSASQASARVRQNVWLSGGLGSGGERGVGLAAIGSAWYAYGHVALGARVSEGAPWEHETDTHDKAVLVGLRARSAHAFILGAVGAGRMGGSHSNGEQSGTRTYFADETSVAFGVEGGVTYHVIGIGFDVFGARTQRLNYSGIALSIQLGDLE